MQPHLRESLSTVEQHAFGNALLDSGKPYRYYEIWFVVLASQATINILDEIREGERMLPFPLLTTCSKCLVSLYKHSALLTFLVLTSFFHMFNFQHIAVNFENLEAGNGYIEIQIISVLSLCSSLSLGNWIVVLDREVTPSGLNNRTLLISLKWEQWWNRAAIVQRHRCFVSLWKQLQTGGCDMTKRGVPSDKTLQYTCKNGDIVNFTLGKKKSQEISFAFYACKMNSWTD